MSRHGGRVGRIIGDGIGRVKEAATGKARGLTPPRSGNDNPRVPLYEYECEKCGHRFEKIQKLSDPDPKRCPECRGKLRKLPSAPAIRFKGSGWYITDYGRKDSYSEDKEKGEKGDPGDKGGKTDKAEKAETAGKEEKGAKASEEKGKKPAAPKKDATGAGSGSSRKKSSDD